MEEEIITDLSVLQDHLDKMINRIEQRNHVLQQFQALQITLFTLNSLPEMIESVLTQTRQFFQLDTVTLALLNEDGKIAGYLREKNYVYQENPNLVLLDDQALISSELIRSVYIGGFDADKHSVLFPDTAELLGNIISIPLSRHSEYLGSLNLACAAELPAKLRLEFAAQLGFSISICLENHLNFAVAQQAYRNEALAHANNRRFLEQRLVEELVRGQRIMLSLSCFVLEVDFPPQKSQAESLQLESQVLNMVAETVKRQLRVGDVFSYYEGKKFAAFLTNVPEEILIAVVERLKTAIGEQVINFNQRIVPLSVTVGYTSYALNQMSDEGRTHAQIAGALISEADAKLYEAKQSQPVQAKKITAA